MPKADSELEQLLVAMQHVELAAPKKHPLTKLKKLRLRDLTDTPFVWFPRWASPAFYDRLMHACYRGGLETSPLIVPGGTKRGDDPKCRVDRPGGGMGSWNSTLAMPLKPLPSCLWLI